MNKVKVYIQDCHEALQSLPDNSVHCCVTSPPYWGLRDYGVDGQLGLESTPDEYVANMVQVFREVRRVLRDDGTLWLNLGDSFAGSGRGLNGDGTPSDRGDAKQGTNRWTTVGSYPKRDHGLKPKDLVGIPWRVAFALQADGVADARAVATIERVRYEMIDAYEGQPLPDKVIAVLERLDEEYRQAKGDSWWLRSDIIWHKPNPMPESVTDRPTKAHEYIFLLSKSARYYYDADAVREDGVEHKGRAGTFARNGAVSRHILPNQTAAQHRGNRNDRVPAGRNKRTVWTIATRPYKGAHFATFPPDLVEPCIKAGTSEYGVCPDCGAPWKRVVKRQGMVVRPGPSREARSQGGALRTQINGTMVSPPRQETVGWEPTCDHDAEPVPATVLDLFAGALTTGMKSAELQRDSILIELNPEYAGIGINRIRDRLGPLFTTIEVHQCQESS